MSRPRLLIEEWLPTRELGIESVRERAAASALPPLYFLHVWWARRPLVASAGAVLGSVLPAWSPELAERFPDRRELSSEKEYREWFLRLCGILGDPAAADALTRAAREAGKRIPNPFTYKQAYKNQPSTEDLALLQALLHDTWERLPTVLDPTAGGGSIPFEAIRYGLRAYANDLNPIATAVLRAGIELPARFGSEIVDDLRSWGSVLCERMRGRLGRFFPDGPDGQVADFLFARTVACPRTGKLVPLAPNWWLSKDKGGVAVRLVTDRDGTELDQPEFEIVRGDEIDRKATDNGTITRGVAVSPWDHLVIDGDYIKAEAQAGRMGSILYAVAIRGSSGRDFRAPTPTDLEALRAAEEELERLLPRWESEDVVPDEMFPEGNDMRPVAYGMPRWRDMFSPRQLLVHGTFVEEFRKLIPEVREAISDRDRADAVLSLLALMQGKAVNWNALLSSWNVVGQSMRSVFDRHDFAFKWTWAEFEGARELYAWCLDQIVDAYGSIAELLHGSGEGALTSGSSISVPAPVVVTQGDAGNLNWLADNSVEAVCIDPPYYDNVMYAELADFFYVWEKRTLGRLWPELFADELTNKEDEAVVNVALFDFAGKKKQELARLHYERKMTAIFEECRRVLTDDGVMTVMFTHKQAEAWDTLGESLLEAGFNIEASWPVNTEREHSLHQRNKAAAASTVYLVCRKRPDRDEEETVFFDSIEAEVREAARDAYFRLTEWGVEGVDRLLATYGPVLSVVSRYWPVYSSEADEATGRARRLHPEEALLVAQKEVTRLQRARLGASHVEFDPISDFWLLAWDTFAAAEYPFDVARKLCLAVGGVDVDDLVRAKVLAKKSGSVVMTEPKGRLRRDADDDLPGVNRDRESFPVLLDALHTALYVLELDGAAAAKSWLDQRRLIGDARFQAFVQAAVNAVPRRREKGELALQEARDLDSLVRAAFVDVVRIPDDDVSAAEGQLAIEYD